MKKMSWLERIVLRGEIVTLEPLAPDHIEPLRCAVRDGEFWKLWFANYPIGWMDERTRQATDLNDPPKRLQSTKTQPEQNHSEKGKLNPAPDHPQQAVPENEKTN